ncbi:alanine-tRNA synthetase second additional domain-containing protein [Terrisporobacter vanillatitrophus]|uniref:alanine-tRNA synthetase second additional domain-containing protein n=1 Tax=Terrisporobacter vanillatitrophus TaxID=3058402 RepID=UPI0033676B7A
MPVDYVVRNHFYSVFFAPRGRVRMYEIGIKIAQQYLTPTDRLIGVIGEPGSGKSMLIKGMFPGLELTNDDDGLNVRPLPIMDVDDESFFSPHTYHIDIRFESAFYQMYELVNAINKAIEYGRRVIVEHFDLIYPLMNKNADLLIGVGGEIIVTRPTIFGPEPGDIAKRVFHSINIRKMAHSAEDLVEHFLPEDISFNCEHGDVLNGFLILFHSKPNFDIKILEEEVNKMIEKDIPIQYYDEKHVKIGEYIHPCSGPRIHVESTAKIENFKLLPEFYYDSTKKVYMLVGLVGDSMEQSYKDLNKI